MKTLLTAINAKYIHSNLAVHSLKAYAARFEDEIYIGEYTINQQVDDILMDIFKQRPDILCFSCYLWNITYIEAIIIEIHKILPETIIWMGGPEVSYNAADVLKRLPQVTGVMKGEGEKTFLELMEYYHEMEQNRTYENDKSDGTMQEMKRDRRRLQAIKGITYREEADICENPWREVMDLSQVPFVYDQMDNFKNKLIYYETSRGCPFSCSYCLSSIDKKLRFREIDLVKKELQFFLDHKVPQVKFVDRTFNCNHEHAMEIWKYIAEHDTGITNFHFEAAADLLNEEELQLIESMRPGLIQLEIGIQSTNPDTIHEIHRVMDFDKVVQIVKRIQQSGNVHQHLDLIAGLPFEDYESFGRSFDEVYALHPAQLQLGFLKVLKGSHMGEMAGAYDLSYQTRPPFEVLKTKWLSYGDILRLKGIEEMVEVYYNSGQFEHTVRLLEEAFDTSFSMYQALSEYYEEHHLNMLNHSRVTRYEILLDFTRQYDSKNEVKYRELLTYDLYLRDNIKNRPEFAGENQVTKEEMRAFYEKEAKEHRFLKGYEQYDKNQLRKMTHLEKIEGRTVLFDYQNRNPLSNQAVTYDVTVRNASCKKGVNSID